MKKLRLYKDEYEKLPIQFKHFRIKDDAGKDTEIEGLKVGRRCFKLEDIEIVEKGKASARSGARHLGECKDCGKIRLMYANGLCAACYQKSNFKKNHPEIAIKRELNLKDRMENAKERERAFKLKSKCTDYPYNLILDTFGETAFSMFGAELDGIDKAHVEVLDSMIDRLTESYKNAVVQYYKENKTFREIGKSFGCTSSWISNLIKRFRDTVEANRQAIRSGDKQEIVYLKHMYNYDNSSKMVTWATIRSKLNPINPSDNSLKELFSPKTYRYLRKAGIYTLKDLENSLNSGDNVIQRVKGVGLDIMSEILNTVYYNG